MKSMSKNYNLILRRAEKNETPSPINNILKLLRWRCSL